MSAVAASRDPALRGPSPEAHILIVDDDARLRRLLKRYIGSVGYRVTEAANAASARRLVAGLRFDLLVMDVLMPGESGLELTSALRDELHAPILLLSALGDSQHRIAGLERGADDYLEKPFEPRELLLRMRSVLRRVREVPADSRIPCSVLRFGSLLYDVARGEFHRDDGSIDLLTSAEADIMRVFVRRPREPLSREMLLAELGGNTESGQDRVMDVRVARLRKKLEPIPASPRYLKTVRGAGYMLVPDDEQV